MSGLAPSPPQAHWDQLLKERPLTLDEVKAWEQWQLDASITFRGKPRARTLRPNLLQPREVERDRTIAKAVVTALLRARRMLMQDEALARLYLGPIWDRFHDLITLDPGYPEHAMFARIDTLPTPEGPKVVEFNGMPAFIPDANRISKLFLELAHRIGFDEQWDIKPLHAFAGLREVILRAYRAWGGTGDPRLVFVVPREAKDFLPVVQCVVDDMTESGLSACLSDPGELAFDGKTLRLRGEPQGMLIRCFAPELVHRAPERMRGILDALRANAVCMFSSFQTLVLGVKSLFALLTDPHIDLGLPREIRTLVHTHVPWTRLLVAGKTTSPEGEPIDLLPWALTRREALVCKPVAGYGGAGVVLGWTIDEASWQQCLERAVEQGGFILQQRAMTIAMAHPQAAEGMPEIKLYRDQSIFVADGDLCGYLTRISEGPIINVAQGASVVPNFVVTPKNTHDGKEPSP